MVNRNLRDPRLAEAGVRKLASHSARGCTCLVHERQRERQRAYTRTNMDRILKDREARKREAKKAWQRERGTRTELEKVVGEGKLDKVRLRRCMGWNFHEERQCGQNGTVWGSDGHRYCRRHRE